MFFYRPSFLDLLLRDSYWKTEILFYYFFKCNPLPTDEAKRIKELEARLERISTENDRLKRIVAEKELQITIMEEVRDLKNPR